MHPKIYGLIGPQGAARVVESESVVRRATIDPMSGFISMREYVPGDDPRMIHWPTTARTGTLMIREHVEVRRPEYTIVLDTARAVGTPDDFEEAVDVAASLACTRSGPASTSSCARRADMTRAAGGHSSTSRWSSTC